MGARADDRTQMEPQLGKAATLGNDPKRPACGQQEADEARGEQCSTRALKQSRVHACGIACSHVIHALPTGSLAFPLWGALLDKGARAFLKVLRTKNGCHFFQGECPGFLLIEETCAGHN